MTVIEVHFLTGRYSATSHHDRGQPEWPPHGARLFSAMVATWADTDVPDPAERAALEWLEAQPPPRITAPEAVRRRVVSHFVPVNDASVISPAGYKRRVDNLERHLKQHDEEIETAGGTTKKAERLEGRISKQRDITGFASNIGATKPASAVALLPEGRGKKERYFPSVTLIDPRRRRPGSLHAATGRVGLGATGVVRMGQHCCARHRRGARRPASPCDQTGALVIAGVLPVAR